MSLWCRSPQDPGAAVAPVSSVRIVGGMRSCVGSTHLRAGTQPVRAHVVVVNTSVPHEAACFRWRSGHSTGLAWASQPLGHRDQCRDRHSPLSGHAPSGLPCGCRCARWTAAIAGRTYTASGRVCGEVSSCGSCRSATHGSCWRVLRYEERVHATSYPHPSFHPFPHRGG